MLKLDKHELFEVAKQFILVIIGRCQFNVFAYPYNLRISVRSIIIECRTNRNRKNRNRTNRINFALWKARSETY